MSQRTAITKVRSCLAAIRPDLDIGSLADDTPLLETRVISSFDVLELILHLEQASGRQITPRELMPGSFRDVTTIARVFMSRSDGE